ncbi:hypothetical protein [Streptacidiphilus sp. PB12-B1b]|nr:hypothetical protein [Streptacidiphilus sp. PB12-B1b]
MVSYRARQGFTVAELRPEGVDGISRFRRLRAAEAKALATGPLRP